MRNNVPILITVDNILQRKEVNISSQILDGVP